MLERRDVRESSLRDVMGTLLVQPTQQAERITRGMQRFASILWMLALLAYGITWLFAAFGFSEAWRDGSWSAFWSSYRTHLNMLALFGGAIAFRALASAMHDAMAVRRAVEAGDENVVPIAAYQPSPLSSGEQPVGAERIHPLLRAGRASAKGPMFGAAILLFTGAILLVVGLAILFVQGTQDQSGLLLLAIFVNALAGLLICFGLLFAMLARRWSSPLVVTADDWGVEWAAPAPLRRHRRIAWHEARLFCRLPPSKTSTGERDTIYALDAGDTVLGWALPATAGPEQRAAGERLTRLVATRTRLPLREINVDIPPESTSEAAEPMSQAPQDARRPRNVWLALLLQPSCLIQLILVALAASLGIAGLVAQRLHP